MEWGTTLVCGAKFQEAPWDEDSPYIKPWNFFLEFGPYGSQGCTVAGPDSASESTP
jgi:hypothetical protein